MNLRSKINNMNESSTLDVEHIAFQYNRIEVEATVDSLKKIVEAVLTKQDNLKNIIRSQANAVSESLSSLIGYNISLVFVKDSNFSTVIIPSKVKQDVLLRDNKDAHDTYESMESNDSNKHTLDSILKMAYNSLDSTMMGSGVKIDLNKGTVRGLDKEFTQIIFVDLEYVIEKYSLTAEECMACLLHEIGHTFMYLLHLKDTSENTSTLLDTIKEEYIKNSKEAREVLTIAYSNITGVKSSEVDGMSTVELMVDLGRELIGTSTRLNRKDVEHTADVFAARFGFGYALTTAVSKMMLGKEKEFNTWNNIGISLLTPVVTTVWIFSMIVSSIFLLVGYAIPMMYVHTLYMKYLGSYSMGLTAIVDTRYSDTDYDSTSDRLRRLKLQMISSLKEADGLPNETIKIIISQVDAVTNTLSTIKQKRKFTDKVKALFNKKYDRVDLSYAVEELLSSELILTSSRLRVK